MPIWGEKTAGGRKFAVVLLLMLILACVAPGAEKRDPPATRSGEAKPAYGSCRNVALSEVPSPDAKLRAVIARTVCKDKRDEEFYPWSYIYVVKPEQDLNQGSPLYLIGFPSGYESRGSKKRVPLRIEWYSATGLTLSYPLGTVVREVPYTDPALRSLFGHGVMTFTHADEKLGDLRTGKLPHR